MRSSTHVFAWTCPSHEHIERSVDWFWALGILALAGAVVSIILGNILLGIIIIIGAISLGLLAAKGAKSCGVGVSERGISVDHKLYPYRSLKSFWIDNHSRMPPHLILSADSILSPQIVIPLSEDLDARALRNFLIEHLEEKEQYESPITRIAELLGL